MRDVRSVTKTSPLRSPWRPPLNLEEALRECIRWVLHGWLASELKGPIRENLQQGSPSQESTKAREDIKELHRQKEGSSGRCPRRRKEQEKGRGGDQG